MRLVVQNFRRYVGVHVFEFTDNAITLLKGASGDGKSTILMALVWAFFGGAKGNAVKPLDKSIKTSSKDANALTEIKEFGANGSATVVIIHFNEMVVRRKASATSGLEVAIGDESVLTGDAASAYVHSFLGTKNLWTSASYIGQGYRNPLMTMSNNDKFLVLYELTFSTNDDSPEGYITKITELASKAKKAKRDCSARLAVLKDQLEEFSNEHPELMNGFKEFTSEQEIDDLEDLVTDTENRIAELRKKYHKTYQAISDRKAHSTTKTSLTTMIREAESELSRLRDTDLPEVDVDLDTLREDIDLLRSKIRDLERSKAEYDSLVAQQDEISEIDEDDTDLQIVRAYLDARQKLKTLLNQTKLTTSSLEDLGVYHIDETLRLRKSLEKHNALSFTQDLVSRTSVSSIGELNKVLHELYVAEYRRKHKLGKVRSPKTSISIDIETSKIPEFIDTLTEISRAHVMIGPYLVDPDIRISVMNQNLNVSEIRNYIKQATNMLSVSDEVQNLYQTLDDRTCIQNKILDSILSKFDGSLNSNVLMCHDSDLEDYKKIESITKQFLEARKYVKTLDLDVTQAVYDQLLENQERSIKKREDLGRIQGALARVPVVHDMDPSKISTRYLKKLHTKHESKITEYQEAMNAQQRVLKHSAILKVKEDHHKSLIQDLYRLTKEAKIDTTVSDRDLRDKVATLSTKIEVLEGDLSKYRQYSTLESMMAKIENSEIEEEELALNEATAVKALKLIGDVAIDSIHDTITNLANLTNAILAELFPEESMTVRFQLSQKRVNNQNSVDMNLNYRGTVYESVALLSGGEADRLSLALTMSMSIMTRSALVLLDECMASLDDVMKDICFSALRKYLPDKTVINVCHSISEGSHDQIYRLKSRS